MAKRPDHFSQKLLDDLRIRKEKLGFSSTSGQRNVQAGSASEMYRSSHRSFHAGQTTKNKISEKNTVSMDVTQMLGRRQSKTAHPAGSSQDIVPFQSSANLLNSVDVSMALALALSNSGKLQNVQLFSNIAVGNERIMHHGSLYLGERNSQRLPTRMKHHKMDQNSFLTNLQTGDISIGIQQLNNILQAYSSGSKFTRESIEIGRELLRGAMDLEESLKMLIIVQDASDYMVGSQGKQVRLLKGAKEDDKMNPKKMTRRTSSYDGSSRHSQMLLAKENANAINQGQRVMAPSQSRGTITTRNPKESLLHTSKQSTTHRRSMSYNSLSIPESQQTGNARKHAQSNELIMFSDSNRNLAASENFTSKNMNPTLQGEKVRMPSVIAKLMGLEELPVIKQQMNKEKEEIDRKSRKETDQILKGAAEKTKFLQTNVRRDAEKKIHEKSIDEIKLMNSIEVNYSRGKTYLMQSHDIETSIQKDNLQKVHLKMDKKVEDANKNDSVAGSTRMKHVILSKDKINVQEQTRQTKEERIPQDGNRLVSENQEHKGVRRSQCQDEVDNKDVLKAQKKDEEWSTLTSNQINVFKASPCKSIVHRVNHNCAIQGVAKETKLHAKVKLKLNRTRSSDQEVKNEEKTTYRVAVNKSISGKHNKIEQTKKNTKNSQVKDPRSSCTYLQSDRKTGCRSLADKPSVTKLHTENKTLSQVPLTPIVKRVNISSTENMDIVNMTEERSKNYKKSDTSKDNESQDATKNGVGKDLNQQASSSHEEHIWTERNSQTKEITSHDPASAQHIRVTLPPNIPALDARWKSKVKEKRLDAEINRSNTTNQRKTNEKSEGLLNSTSEVESFDPKERHPEDQISDGQYEKYSTKTEVPEQKKRGLLAKNLSMFTRQLTHSQQFLDTAKTIFEFEIPTGLVQTIESAFPNDESKLLLDSGLELIRRKGTREVTYNIMRYHAHLEVRSFSELIKELNDDIESLNLPSKPGADCLNAAEFLYMMLERDIHNKNPDCNCMWDFGWNSSTFAVMEKDEIAGVATKQILDGLICEMARDLCL